MLHKLLNFTQRHTFIQQFKVTTVSDQLKNFNKAQKEMEAQFYMIPSALQKQNNKKERRQNVCSRRKINKELFYDLVLLLFCKAVCFRRSLSLNYLIAFFFCFLNM